MASSTSQRPYRSTSLNQSATDFYSVGSSQLNLVITSPEATVQHTARTAGTASNLYARISANSIAATPSATFTFRKASADSTMTFTVASTATGEFEDTTHSVTISAGDVINIKVVMGASGANTITPRIVGILFASAANTSININATPNGAAFSTASVTNYLKPAGQCTTVTAETTSQQFKSRVAGTLKNLGCQVNTNTWTTTNPTIIDRLNGAAGNLSVSVTVGTTGWFEDTTHSTTLAVGDLFNRAVVIGTGSGSFASQTYGDLETTNNTSQYLCGPNNTAYSASATSYDPMQGQGANDATESNVQTKVGIAGVLDKYEVFVSANTIVGNGATTSRVNAGAGTGSITITGLATGWFEDTTHSDTVVTTDEWNWKTVAGAAGTSMTVQMFGVKSSPTVTTVLVMAVDMPSTAVSKLGLYSMTSGATVTITGGAGVGTFSATQAGKFAVGVWINGNLSGAGNTNYQATTFDGASTVTLVGSNGVTAAPDCSNKAFRIGSCVAVSLSDTAVGVPVTAAIASGTGALTGTTTVNSNAAGVAFFGDLGINGSGAHTIQFTASGYTSVTSSSCTVSAVYVTTADYVYGCYQEPTLGLVIPFALFVRNGASVNTPERLLTYCGSANTSGFDNVQNLSDAVTTDITANKTTFPYTSFMPQMPTGASEATTKGPWRLAMPGMHQFLTAAGYNIDYGYLFYMGYSMGAIQAPDLAYMFPTYWVAMMIMDSGWFGPQHISKPGEGPMPSYFDTNESAALEFVRMVGDSIPIYDNQSDDSVAPFDTKTMAVLWTAYQASGYDVTRYANSITGPVIQNVQPGDRRPLVQWNGYNHGALDAPASSRTTDATMWNWMLSVARQGNVYKPIPHGHEFAKGGRRFF